MATKVICKNHGIIQEIPDAMWMNGPPTPYAFCPTCGEKTVVERVHIDPGFYRTPTQDELRVAKQREIDNYRKKYWPSEYK